MLSQSHKPKKSNPEQSNPGQRHQGLLSGMVMRIEAMWWRHEQAPLLLRWVSRIYAAINRRNLGKRSAASVYPPLPLISIGNITVGGSGKTPFVIWLCAELKARGYRPVVLCRGDGGRLKQARRILPNDAAEEVGDEALLLALRCNAPVIGGKDRVGGCRLAAELGDVIVLDDGFQYLQLKRNCDIVLIPDVGLGNGQLLPAGPLREPLDALQRADLLVRTGSENAEPLSKHREWRWQVKIKDIRPFSGGDIPDTEDWLALAGIARADRFFSAAAERVHISRQMGFPDHHRYTVEDVERILK
ncbi:MAG: tetraacyldisaccharide 4'-kinase, partial [Mariprofundaceae bacterium]|nr:tetraacyldisaccharide 4'-kinase [Mariprofundaceae bacterium]